MHHNLLVRNYRMDNGLTENLYLICTRMRQLEMSSDISKVPVPFMNFTHRIHTNSMERDLEYMNAN